MKTSENDQNVFEFLSSVENKRRADDTRIVVEMMERITGCPPKMWSDSIIGFERYTYKRKDGSQHSFMITGVSPRKTALTVYIMPGFSGFADQLARLGKYRNSVSCLYISRLENIDIDVLEDLIARSVAEMRERYKA